MKETGQFFLFLFVCLVLAAVLTVPLVATGWLDHPPQRIMGRLAQVFILLGLWPFLRWLGLDSRQALGYGLAWRPFARAVVLGWLAGFVMLLVLVAALVALEVRVPDRAFDAAWLVRIMAQALLAGLLIGLLEETFFRGALYTAIRRHHGLLQAALWSALLYAVLHMMKPSGLPDGVPFDWLGSAQMFAQVFVGLFQWSHVDSLVALFLVGVLLALVREHTGHIGWCIGLHAGWVFVIQVTRRLTGNPDDASLAVLVGDYDGVIGWLAAVWVGALALVYWFVFVRRAPSRRGRG
ncbi:CPBP family intramembrane glutamic endopeptidase [Thioalkalicoccus limnaeus]|uniref:CPBP family intramembrane glutamic endopeptidase n=1 Tax=Thioalkalicoccus limnaeus TaxID=120681 RepID=A0ABV4BGX2_9GAMM